MPIIRLDEARRQDVETAGGKGANLGELIHQGFPVPPGFIVTASTYREFFPMDSLPAPDTRVEDAAALCASIRYRIMSVALPREIEDRIREHHESLKKTVGVELVYAVRSSATAEDMSDASFAGQHETYYYVDLKNLTMMIKKCWASLWSDAAYSYRETRGIHHADVDMAVIVQQMIPSSVSGVTFTANPVNGDRNVIVTEASWGMGAAIVDGRVSPDQYVIDKTTDDMTSVRIADKKFMVPTQLTHSSTSRLQPVPSHLRRAECLDRTQLETISCWARKAEDWFGCPQDIEWSFADDKFYILQSRPVTIMGQIKDHLPKGKFVLFKPMVENFTDPLLPLTQDILVSMFPMMTVIHGRVYVNLKHLRALVPLKISDANLAALAYLGKPEASRLRLSVPRLVVVTVIGFIAWLFLGVLYRRTRHMPDDFMESFREKTARVVQDPAVNAPDTMAALFLKNRFFEPVGNMVLMVNLAAIRYVFFLALLTGLLKRWAPELNDDAASLLTSGNPGVLSTEMGREIRQLAVSARETPELAALVLREEPDRVLRQIPDCPGGEQFLSLLHTFLEKHGHRALKEFELNAIRWEEDPSPVIAMVRNYLLAPANPADAETRVAEQRRLLETRLKGALTRRPLEKLLAIRTRIITWLRKRAMYFIKLRENSRFYHIMGFYAVRRKVRATEDELLARGTLKCRDDIFYLRWTEIEDLLADRVNWEDVEDLIRLRRLDHIRLGKMRPPRTVGIDAPEPPPAVAETVHGIQGQPASPGTCEGIARVLMDPATDAEIRPGEILVAPYTDPAWTPLFLTAAAAVVEVGSYLSHAGTIAREYGMPCVVDAECCTTRIRTGDRIRVDGSNGTVLLLHGTDGGDS